MNGQNDYIGFLEVVVKTANGALPVEGALVNIYDYTQDDGVFQRGHLLFSLETDENGKAPRVAVPAKDKSLSQSYGNESPYTTYNITASKEGFYTNDYVNAPVFQGITSIQPVTLIPLAEYASEDNDFPDTSRRYVEVPATEL